jgi:thiamine-monophosphate kinase
VSGTLGGAALAVDHLLRGSAPPAGARAAFARPVPRIGEARWLVARGVPTSMLDVSDGVGGDAAHLAAASQVKLLLEPRSLPLHPDVAATGEDPLRWAASGGEDYELLFTAPPGVVDGIREPFHAATGTRLTRIGVVEEGRGVLWSGGATPPGYQHFSEAP